MDEVKGGDFLSNLIDQVGDLAVDFVQAGGVRVSVKTNLGPELPVFNGTGEGTGLAQALGIRAGVIVRDRNGRVLQTIGNPPPTEPLKVAIVAIIIGLIGVAIVRGVLPR